jgi:translation initiation factor 2 alpha subunit (eIF-2alpha)
MKIKKRKPYNNMLDAKLMKSLRILAAKQDKRQNDLLEEAIRDLLKKYGKKMPPNRAY